MIIIPYDGSDDELERIVTEESQNGRVLVVDSNTEREKYLGFNEP